MTLSPNTCAVRLAYAIFLADKTFFKGVKANAERFGLPARASELAQILARKIKRPLPAFKPDDINQQQGIIFFDTIPGYAGSGHISLWERGRVLDGGNYFGHSPRIDFWAL